mgnify:CR=1 FL=1
MGREYYNGRDNYLIYVSETSFGAGGSLSVSNHFGKVQNVSLNMANNLVSSVGIGEGINFNNTQLGQFDISGSFTTKPTDFNYLLYGIGNVRAGDDSTATPYKFPESPQIGYSGAGFIPTAKLRLGSKAIASHQTKDITGVTYDSWSLSGNIGQELLSTISFTGKTVLRGTSIDSYLPISDRTYVFNSGSVVWGASDVLSIVSFEVSCNLNPYYPVELNTRYKKQPVLGLREYNWSISLNMYVDDTGSIMSATELLSEFFQGTNAPKDSGALTGDDLTITIQEGVTSGDKVLIIDLDNSFINDWSESPSLDGNVTQITINGTSWGGKTDTLRYPIKWYTTT